MRKKVKVMIGLISTFIILLGAVLVYYFGAIYPSFNKISKKEFEIPGLSEGFVPQGLDYIEESDVFLVSGYMKDGSPSRVYVVDYKTGTAQKYVTMKNIDGSDYVGHAGGITHYNNSFWLVGDKKLNYGNLNSILSATDKTSVGFVGGKETGNGCDFVSEYDGKLIVGEFYRKKGYEVNASHCVNLSDGSINYALSYIYEINESKSCGVGAMVGAISMPNEIQGMSVSKGGEIVLSASFSIPSSRILVYHNVLEKDTSLKIGLKGKEIPLYVLSEEELINEIKAPTMSEEIVLVNGRVFVLFESACQKYKMINRTRLKNVYSLDI